VKTRKRLGDKAILVSSAIGVSSLYVRKYNMELYMVVPEYILFELSGSQVSIKVLFSNNRVASRCLTVVHYSSMNNR